MKARHEFKFEFDFKEYLRTYFAAMAMQAFITNGTAYTEKGEKSNNPYWISINALRYADELLNQLEKTEKTETK